MSPELAEQLLALLAITITAIFGWVSRYIVAKMKAGAARDAVLELTLSAEMVVRHVEQTLRPAMKDGKLTAEEKSQLKAAATRGVTEQLSTTGRKLGKEAIDHAIEAAVHKIHQEQPPA